MDDRDISFMIINNLSWIQVWKFGMKTEIIDHKEELHNFIKLFYAINVIQ